MAHQSVFADAPRRVYWEITKACSLACVHCRAEAAPHADPRELDTRAGFKLLDQLAEADPKPHVILTGGDPLMRADLFDLIAHARGRGLHVSVSPSATPLLDEEAIDLLFVAGVDAISLSIDGSTAGRHDAIRQVEGCFERTKLAAKRAHEVGVMFQVNTLVSRETQDDLPAIEALVRAVGADRWSLFFLVTVGRGSVLNAITPKETEVLLEWLADRSKVPGPILTTTEAPHFRRISRQRASRPLGPKASGHHAGMRDGNGVMFIGHDGEVSPSGFLPLSVGNVKLENPIGLYRESTLFLNLRDPDHFKGRCGRCEFRFLCGGSRARAWAVHADPLAEDPLCEYQPRERGSVDSTTLRPCAPK